MGLFGLQATVAITNNLVFIRENLILRWLLFAFVFRLGEACFRRSIRRFLKFVLPPSGRIFFSIHPKEGAACRHPNFSQKVQAECCDFPPGRHIAGATNLGIQEKNPRRNAGRFAFDARKYRDLVHTRAIGIAKLQHVDNGGIAIAVDIALHVAPVLHNDGIVSIIHGAIVI